MSVILLIAVVLLVAYGLSDLVERLAHRLLFSGNVPVYCVVTLQREAEFFIRKAVDERKWAPCTYEWVIMDGGLCEGEREVAERLCEELHIMFCDRSDCEDLFSARLQTGESMVK